MKFIPIDSFSTLNSLLLGVEAQGCRITVRLEAYTCRHTKEEKQIANSIASYQNNVQMTPPISPSPGVASFDGFAVPQPLPPLVLGGGSGGEVGGYTPVDPEALDERLVYFVTALNTVYESDGYDFSVLQEDDFVCYTEPQLKTEVQNTLDSLPEQCGPAVQRFWPTVDEVVDNAAGGCEYYEFRCPSCDPLADSTVYSRHYILYNKRKKVLVLVVEYGESNPYRGDDGLLRAVGGAGIAGWEVESPTYISTPDHDDEEEPEYVGGKNKDFYGY
ncbi:hypothetical protein ABB37_09182 [Leptomonas pyrrhocoris]|uniref:Maf1 regulator n=1 Tax=Leptomonas pyrrhocoris TaxID=157538 RepID=A0A0M9FRR3_LEPPY|nr:hypothetical protein ABB37_09182 [Leptomonas pyrrhocoris]XP_015652965.1 hypothetical protein ABB37_09182 [Leptomonas pyrrhocoris]XP_015652966.1 hypothetical protein ABB37_09182 [Leptomonas pyrrhocoris]KPA74525.1 hypothetical protein ABB37_09182 [Leptomonas pyrrhocoris]KPA74526.1 hypothetical protein ABB37_09182 [Leptomonas pyrrhocoris]KPA74527.1 hypothetical protein ABB37_09182 [Leptomonas pyrrhocoris]|eukprot:XP_015652964.1 hypothetical protein ABB37_09182 [Leptomonas pyrrhocoris]